MHDVLSREQVYSGDRPARYNDIRQSIGERESEKPARSFLDPNRSRVANDRTCPSRQLHSRNSIHFGSFAAWRVPASVFYYNDPRSLLSFSSLRRGTIGGSDEGKRRDTFLRKNRRCVEFLNRLSSIGNIVQFYLSKINLTRIAFFQFL